MPISCAYCGGAHATPAEVRACWSRSGERSAPASNTPLPQAPLAAVPATEAPVAAAPVTEAPAALPPAGPPARWAGPEALGRSIVLPLDTDAPAPWAGAPEVLVDGARLADPGALAALVDHLGQRWRSRQRTVIRLGAGADPVGDPRVRPGEVDHRPLHLVGPRAELALDTLHHLIWSNSIDARAPGAARWWWPDTPTRWVDGGPLTFLAPIDGVPVVHRIAVEHGSTIGFGTNDHGRSAVELAPDQLAAVTHPGGAARIIAPAGSGKTRVLTERARHLLTAWQLPAGAVCLVAFNTRAQAEMRERTADLPGLQVRTLNALALAIVNGTPPFAPQPRRRPTIDEGQVRRLLDRLVTAPRRRNVDALAPWIEALSLARLGLRSPDEVEAAYQGDVAGFAEVLPRYRALLDREGVLDFDEQIVAALELLLTSPAARAAAQRACRVLLVDEFQDLTPAHVLLVRLLSAPERNVFGVGDDDQTIYGYNGADPAWLIDFARLFPGAGDHPLEVNYRCPGGVVTAVDRLLRRNARRVPKVIRSARPDLHGWSVVTPADPAASLAATVDAVADGLAGSARPADVAVLTRVNSLLAPVQVALAEAKVPVRGGVGREFVERTAVRAALAWLRLAAGSWLEDDLREALKRPSRPLHPRVVDWVGETRHLDDLWRLANRVRTPRDAERIEGLAGDIAALRGLVERRRPTTEVLHHLATRIGLAGSVATLDANRVGMNRGAQDDDLTALAQLATLQPDARRFPAWLLAALDHGRDADAGVTLATVHRVKGQEWPVVVVHEASATMFPHRLADDLEEERRLFHVALTRAVEHVTIVAPDPPSPFVDELTTEGRPRQPGRPAAPRSAAPRSGARSSQRPTPATGPAAERLRAALKATRLALAAGKPAYTVFDDTTLEHLVAERPTTLAGLARIPGMGPKRLERFGDALVVVIEDALDGEGSHGDAGSDGVASSP